MLGEASMLVAFDPYLEQTRAAIVVAHYGTKITTYALVKNFACKSTALFGTERKTSAQTLSWRAEQFRWRAEE
jgi:hypothetical protein